VIGVAVAVEVLVGVAVAVLVGIGVGVAVLVGVGVAVAVSVGVGVAVAVLVGVGVGVTQSANPSSTCVSPSLSIPSQISNPSPPSVLKRKLSRNTAES
jgi:hypothetical protein